MNEQIRTIMSPHPRTVSPEATLAEVMSVFRNDRAHHIPVVRDKQILGLITSYDLLKYDAQLENNSHVRAKEIMNTRLCKISPKDKVGTAAELLLDRRFHALPVVNLRDELKGIITSFDILRYTMNKEYPNPILYKDVLRNQAGSK